MRLFAILATGRPVVAVFRKGPRDWWWVGRWDLERQIVEPGAWLKGTLYPWRSDVSADGELLLYVAAKDSGPAGFLGRELFAHTTYVAVSKLPWLYALAAWGDAASSAHGCHFVADPATLEPGAPGHGEVSGLAGRYGIARTAPEQRAVERRRGWTEDKLCPPRKADDVDDHDRRVMVSRLRPGGGVRLTLEDKSWIGPPGGPEGRTPAYRVNGRAMTDVVWADWDTRGRLLVATRSGHLQVRRGDTLHVLEDHDLSATVPAPREAPKQAQRW
ncbi:MAG: hypothetical protein IT370_22985 [Deltaproteobacteria bacterium]|nr:hypothetical protein [Deltaproteobacteria bacterium]